MSIPVKPTERTVRQRIEADVAAGNLKPVPGLVDRLEAFAAQRSTIETSPYIRAEKARLLGEAEAQLHRDVDTIMRDAASASGRDLDQEEGQLRASAGAVLDMDPGAVTRAQVLVSRINATRDAGAVLSVYLDAEFTNHRETIEIVGSAAETRLSQLAGGKADGPTSPEQVAFLTFKERFGAWRREHPSPRQRVERICRERANRQVAIEQAAAFQLRLYGVGRPAVPARDPRIVEGPGSAAFDALLGRNRNNVRR